MIPPAKIHAVVIGIDKYLAPDVRKLTGAVGDAKRFEAYLETLKIPSENITLLTDGDATRSEILRVLESMAQDDRIEKGTSAMIIYYAGHGGSSKATDDLSNWEVVDGRVEQLCPVDIQVHDEDGQVIVGIPDRTIRVLLDKLSKAKGNNITLILDCCHSAGMNRDFSDDHYDADSTVRCISKPPPISGTVDRHLFESAPRVLGISKEFQGMEGESHVLLAACSSNQFARESGGQGHFTTALLNVLRNSTLRVHNLTYMSLMHRLVMPRGIDQTPHCDGIFRDRRLFDIQTPGADRPDIVCRRREHNGSVSFLLEAGKYHGVTEGSEYKIFGSDLLDHESSPAFEIAQVKSTWDFTSLLELLQSCHAPPSAIASRSARSRQITWKGASTNPVPVGTTTANAIGYSQSVQCARLLKSSDVLLRLYCSDKAYVQSLVLNPDNKGPIVAVDQPDEADLVLKLDRGVVNFEHGPHTEIFEPDLLQRGLSTLLSGTTPSDTSKSSLGYTCSVIDSYAQSLKHFKRIALTPAVDDILKVELKRVKMAGLSELFPVGDNLLDENTDTVSITTDRTQSYGLTLRNLTNVRLFVHIFFFYPDTLEIKLWYRPQSPGSVHTIHPNELDTPLGRGRTLTAGYGNGGVPPFNFDLEPEKSIAASFLKIFVSPVPADMACLAQPSPFHSVVQSSSSDDKDKARAGPQLAREDEIESCDLPAPYWKSITIIETHPKGAVSVQAPALKPALIKDSKGFVEPPPRGLSIAEGSRATELLPATGWFITMGQFVPSPIKRVVKWLFGGR